MTPAEQWAHRWREAEIEELLREAQADEALVAARVAEVMGDEKPMPLDRKLQP